MSTTTSAERRAIVLDLAAVRATDFMKPRPGPIDPRSCPACALVKSIAIEAAETRDRELTIQWVELASTHAQLGHPWDRRWAAAVTTCDATWENNDVSATAHNGGDKLPGTPYPGPHLPPTPDGGPGVPNPPKAG
ncbi:hypothetical protein ABR738_13865 [Streptomyces sp. Edi4]|uniref:hypothetical protein n=1 Tax=Streptomyces sp. Edi4 TaxID=3162527 RepID=UPI0033056D33